MSGAMLHGLGDCTPERNCGCIGTGDGHPRRVAQADGSEPVSRPPSQAVIEAVEQVMCRLIHGEDWTAPVALPESSESRHRVAACYSCQRNAVEVARAAEVAALRAAAERMEDLIRDDIPLTAAFAAGAAAKRLDHWADELTDTDDRSQP